MTTKTNGSLKRKYPRSHFVQPICITSKLGSFVARAEEIGEGGIAFVCSKELDLDSTVIINFYLGTGNFHCLSAVVKNKHKRSDEFVVGLSFEDVSLGLKRQIRSYVAQSSHAQKQTKTTA